MRTFHAVLFLLLIWATLPGCQPDVASSLPPRPDPASNSTNRTSIVNTVASPSAQQSAASRVTILLTDRATASGVNFAYRNGEETGNLAILESLGGGVGIIDFDQDGDLDLAVSLVNEPVALLSNETQTDNHWLQLRLIGTVSCRDAFGARVIVETNSGRRIRQVKGGTSYASTSDACLHFGLGDTEHS